MRRLAPTRKLTWSCIFALVAMIALAPQSLAQFKPQGTAKPAPDVDARAPLYNAQPTAPTAGLLSSETETAIETLRLRVRNLTVRWSALTGAPSRIYSTTQPLTGPSPLPARQVAAEFINGNLALFSLIAEDLTEVRVSREYVTSHNGVTHLTFQQQLGGVDIFGATIIVNVDREGRILNLSGEPMTLALAGQAPQVPILTDVSAGSVAADSAGVTAPAATNTTGLLYFPMPGGELRLAWKVTVEDSASPNMYETIVDASDGTLLFRRNLTHYSHIPAHGQIFAQESPIDYNPNPASNTILPRVDAPFTGVEHFPHNDPHYDWWNGSGQPDRTTTISNNVTAQEDRDGNNTGGFRPTAASGENFNFPVDFTMDPLNSQSAAIVNLFYWNNRLHDILYGLGFDEVSGNFQVDNFGLGGLGGDQVIADAQDNRDGNTPSLCNANFGTPADGNSPRMQMFLCDNTTPERDGDFDNAVIIHEYAHGVHSRLVDTQGFQAGNEGWGDYFALSFLSDPADDIEADHTLANWLFGGGARRQPYSTDQTVFTRTYADIVDGATCTQGNCANDPNVLCTQDSQCGGMTPNCNPRACTFDSDCVPPATTQNQGTCSPEIHNTGELWAETLWLARSNLVRKVGAAVGGPTMDQLVIDGMKLSPVGPDFLDNRDMILLADLANNGGAFQCLIWDAFASMGMGVSALSLGNADFHVLEAFDTPGNCTPNIDVSGPLDFGDICTGGGGTNQLEVFNTGTGQLIVTSVARASGSAAITVDPIPTTPVVIAPGAHVDFTIKCDPTTTGSKTAVIRVSSNDPDQPTIDLTYTCNAPTGDVRVTGSPTFGEVCAGTLAEKTLSVCNVGACNLNVTSVSFVPACNDFTLVNNPFPAPVSPDSCEDVVIRFTPTSAGEKSCNLRIVTDDPDSPTINQTVTANTPAASIDVPPDQGFAPTVLSSVGACTTGNPFPVSNTGTCDLRITDLAITTNPAEYSTSGLPSFPIILEPGHIAGDGDLSLVFGPDVLGRYRNGEVRVTYVSDPVAGTTTSVTRALCGEGVRTGARVLVTAGGVPLDNVTQIKLQRLTSNRNKNLLDSVDNVRNVPLTTVLAAGPCGQFQYHREYGTVSNPIMLPTGSYQVTVSARVNGRNVKKTVGFSVDTCDFNPTIVVNF